MIVGVQIVSDREIVVREISDCEIELSLLKI